MQTIEFKQSLMEAAAEVLESMCFLSVLGEAAEPAVDEEWIGSRLQFLGENAGSFGMRLPVSTAEIVAGNFLGHSGGEITSAQVEEVICELSNMICGSFLSRFRKDAIFDLAHPVCSRERCGGSSGATVQTLELDEGLMQIWLEFNP